MTRSVENAKLKNRSVAAPNPMRVHRMPRARWPNIRSGEDGERKAARGQPRQCPAQHGAEDGSGQDEVEPQLVPAWFVGPLPFDPMTSAKVEPSRRCW